MKNISVKALVIVAAFLVGAVVSVSLAASNAAEIPAPTGLEVIG